MGEGNGRSQKNWRNINVLRNRKYEPLVDTLCSKVCEELGKPVFEYNKDLMVLAAMIGFLNQKREAVEADGIQITLGTYSSDEKDGYIFLLALLENRNMDCLKGEQLNGSVRIFEEYCNGGLSIIEGWLEDSPGDPCGLDAILGAIKKEYVGWAVEEAPDYGGVEF